MGPDDGGGGSRVWPREGRSRGGMFSRDEDTLDIDRGIWLHGGNKFNGGDCCRGFAGGHLPLVPLPPKLVWKNNCFISPFFPIHW